MARTRMRGDLMEDYIKPAVRWLSRYAAEGKIPGAAIALVTREGVTSACVGNASLLPENVPLTADRLFDLASVTKVLATTTLALQCLEKGLFTLSTPVSTILPDFPHRQVTIGHLLTHTSGVCSDDKAYKKRKDRADLTRFFYEKPLDFTPGSRVLYSDFGYITLGYAIEAVYGKLDERFQTCIAQPLEMRDSGYLPSERGLVDRCVPTELTEERGLICGTVHDGKAFLLGGVSGNAGLFSTLEDMTHYVRMILDDGEYRGRSVLKRATVRLLKHCYTEGLNERRTLGWWSNERSMSFGDYYSESCIYHTGFTGTSVYIDFMRQCGIILLTNRIHPARDNPWIGEIRNTVHNVILSQVTW